jgi:hypothetical protein
MCFALKGKFRQSYMRSRVAVATVSGKTYFLVVNEMKKRHIPFLSLIPGKPIPVEIKVVITTEEEKQLVHHERVLIYDEATEPNIIGSEIVKILQGKESYETVVIGIDPGEVFGLAVIADSAIIETENCLSVQEVANKIKSILKTMDFSLSAVSVKIGNGVPAHKEVVEVLDAALPSEVQLEIVNEVGTNHFHRRAKRSRRLRHIASAMCIARRVGQVYPRREIVEQNT